MFVPLFSQLAETKIYTTSAAADQSQHEAIQRIAAGVIFIGVGPGTVQIPVAAEHIGMGEWLADALVPAS